MTNLSGRKAAATWQKCMYIIKTFSKLTKKTNRCVQKGNRPRIQIDNTKQKHRKS